jgi:hypothetical protein
MSEQELMPEPQAQEQQLAEIDKREIQYSPRAFGQQAPIDGKALPKDEPPSSYDEPMTSLSVNRDYQHGYTAQSYTTYSHQQQVSNTTSSGQQHNSADGDAYERHYRPNYANYAQGQHYQQWNVPSWARPQTQNRSGMSIFWLIILGLIFIGPLMHLLGILFAFIGVLFLLIFVPLMLFMVIGVPLIIMRALARPFMGVGWRRNTFWMGYRPRRRGMWW